MIILIGNQKGGAGKSTLSMLLANYLSMTRKRDVTIMDMDYQQSLYAKAEKSKILENEALYEVVATSLAHFPSIRDLLTRDKSRIILVDLPGKLDDDGLMEVFKSADIVLTPFAYDEFTMESTLIFSMVLKKVNPTIPIIFVPNRIKTNVKYETKEEIHKVLGRFGSITDPITERIDFQRINFFIIPISIVGVIVPIFDAIYEQYLMREEEV